MKEKRSATDKAFTLIEILLVVCIIGILAGIAIPNYNKAKERALVKGAMSNLVLIGAAEKISFIENSVYVECTGIGTDAESCNTKLGLDITDESWDYRVWAWGPPYGFQARATRNSGAYAGCAYVYRNDDTAGPVQIGSTTCP